MADALRDDLTKTDRRRQEGEVITHAAIKLSYADAPHHSTIHCPDNMDYLLFPDGCGKGHYPNAEHVVECVRCAQVALHKSGFVVEPKAAEEVVIDKKKVEVASTEAPEQEGFGDAEHPKGKMADSRPPIAAADPKNLKPGDRTKQRKILDKTNAV